MTAIGLLYLLFSEEAEMKEKEEERKAEERQLKEQKEGEETAQNILQSLESLK